MDRRSDCYTTALEEALPSSLSAVGAERRLEQALKLLARHLHERGKLKLEQAFVDATFASAKKGASRLVTALYRRYCTSRAPKRLIYNRSHRRVPNRFEGEGLGSSMNTAAFDRINPDRELLHVKDNLAAHFREEIISGRLAPGEKIVEVRWAKKLGMSQTSVREALNILSAEGYVQKGSGRTAQVTQLTDEDVVHSYELRAVLEGYAARIVAEKQPNLAPLEQALEDMRSAVLCNNLRAFYERDLHFHVLMAEMTGNRMLVQAVKRIILPLFAFVVIRVHGARTGQDQWMRSLDQHARIIDALRTQDPVFAERLVVQSVDAFLKETRNVVKAAE